MTLSTLPFKNSGLRRFYTIVVIAVAGWVLGALYTLFINPEIRLFRHSIEVKLNWAQKLDREHTNKVIVFGGSSSAFSIDGEHALNQHHLPLANFGLGAGMGTRFLTRFAVEQARPGDTLIMMLEPGLLYGDQLPTQVAAQCAIAIGRPRLAIQDETLVPKSGLSWKTYFGSLRPGGYHFFTLLGKIVRGQKLYRYSASDFDRAGQQQTAVKAPLITPRGRVTLSADAKNWLVNLRDWCRTNGVNLYYSLPWAFCPAEELMAFRGENAAFLSDLNEFIPVLRDTQLGAYGEKDHFADTSYHLNETGARLRTDILVHALNKREFWEDKDLLSLSDFPNKKAAEEMR